jgi:TRAP-type C4-dicarboxylate transport system permease large subunit
MYTPPFGFNLFISSSIFDTSIKKIALGVLPFIVASLLVSGNFLP